MYKRERDEWRIAAIRLMQAGDIAQMARAFEEPGWDKPAAQYERYLMEQAYQVRDVYMAMVDGQFAGYLTICWKSTYQPFRAKEIPEIVLYSRDHYVQYGEQARVDDDLVPYLIKGLS